MMETLTAYQKRTAFMQDSLPADAGLVTPQSLTLKVDEQGDFKPFYGDTVIFSLPGSMIAWLTEVQEQLYAACGDCLTRERLAPDTFHVTLHDLLSQPGGMPDGVAQNRERVPALLEDFRGRYPRRITVRSVCLFNMMNTSMVMGFEPAGEADCAELMDMYERLSQVVPLPYPLTLHATLAYYRPGAHDAATVGRLRALMQRVGSQRREWTLSLDELHYATFESMGGYAPVEAPDPWKLNRFVRAQALDYDHALRELRAGGKRGHWMWYIFPQLIGLGRSERARMYGISGLDEAKAYLAHPVLGPRLVEIARALLENGQSDPVKVMGYPDNLKLRSCMTLFAEVPGADLAFARVLSRYFDGQRDIWTLERLDSQRARG